MFYKHNAMKTATTEAARTPTMAPKREAAGDRSTTGVTEGVTQLPSLWEKETKKTKNYHHKGPPHTHIPINTYIHTYIQTFTYIYKSN